MILTSKDYAAVYNLTVMGWKIIIFIVFGLIGKYANCQPKDRIGIETSLSRDSVVQIYVLKPKQFISTSEFLDAAINSVNSFNSLVKKENYRNKITALNNPTSSDMGFNLENEIQSALKPLLAKAKNTNTEKFSEAISFLFTTHAGTS